MFIKEITVDQELTNYIERLSREVEGTKEIIAFMLENNKNVNTEAFKSYKKEFDATKAEFDLAREDVQKKYVPQALIDADGDNTSWELDYGTAIIKVKYNGHKLTEEQFNAFFA